MSAFNKTYGPAGPLGFPSRKSKSEIYGSTFNAWQTKAALGEASGVTGGYTVPPEFYRQLLAIIEEQTFIRPRAFVR